MSLESRARRVPIRLVPHRGRIAFGAAFIIALIILAGILFVIRLPPRFLAFENVTFEPVTWIVLIPPLLLLLVLIRYFTVFISCFIHGSPLDHVAIDRDGIARKSFLGRRAIRWDEIGQFSTTDKIAHFPGNRLLRWYVIAEANGVPKFGDYPIKSALLSFAAADFGSMFSPEKDTANLIADWLNRLLVQSRLDKPIETVIVPSALFLSIAEMPRVR